METAEVCAEVKPMVYTTEKLIITRELVEFKIPYYSKNICYADKVVSPTKCVHVYFGGYGGKSISISNASIAFGDDRKEITAEEFELIFQNALHEIIELEK